MQKPNTVCAPDYFSGILSNVFSITVKNVYMIESTNYGDHHTIAIYNMSIDSVIAFRDNLNKVIQNELDKQVNEAGNIPNVPEERKDLRIT